MRATRRALLLDDDEFALEYLRAVLLEHHPGLEIVMRKAPDPEGDFDFYFIDDDFEGIRLAEQLARDIRSRKADAVVIAFSASLDEAKLKKLLNAGCNGVCDKKVPEDMPQMLAALERCMRELETVREERGESGYLLRTFRQLFREWNRRLDQQRGE